MSVPYIIGKSMLNFLGRAVYEVEEGLAGSIGTRTVHWRKVIVEFSRQGEYQLEGEMRGCIGT